MDITEPRLCAMLKTTENRKIINKYQRDKQVCWKRFRDGLVTACWLLLALAPGVGWAQATSELLRQTIEYAHDSRDPEVAGTRLIAVDFLARFYEARRFEPAWTSEANVQTVLAALQGSEEHGLLPQDFHIDSMRLLRELQAEQPDDPQISANLDLLLTDGLVAYAYQLVYGKVDPRSLAASWNLDRPLLAQDPEQVLEDTLAQGNLAEVLESLIPALPYYGSMRAQLAEYRRLGDRGGWPAVPAGDTLKPGAVNPRVAALRARLAGQYGDIEPSDGNDEAFGTTLEDAVRRFQAQHGLAVDGAVGPATLREMNVTAAERVEQIRVNLERARWLQEEYVDANDLVIVNIAGFYVRLFQDGEVDWETRAIVGTQYHQTPIFAADMKYVVLNPTWTVPRSIIRNEMMPKMKADPDYLPSRNFDLVDQNGNRVDPATVDWANVSARNFPYNVVQRPGPWNALGLVKFIFPNSHAVYLHDTPSRQLFARTGRTFSHGCVRTENPLELAARLLADQPEWTREAIANTIDGGRTKTVYLTEPLRVFILYWTAEPGEDGGVRFYPDVYERDQAVLQALNAPFEPLPLANR